MKPMITISMKGNFNKTELFFERIKSALKIGTFDKYGQMGVNALASATPKDTEKTAKSWKYEVEFYKDAVSIIWANTNKNDGANIAILLQYGHGLKNGGYVAGRDYINPALRPVFDKIAKDMWEEVVKI